MNIDERIRHAEKTIANATAELAALKAKYKAATDFTNAVLKECAEAGLDKVAIGVAHDSIPQSTDFPWPEDSIFGIGPIEGGRDKSGVPAIWGVAERTGIFGGCGNSMQAQADTSGLIDGVYHLFDGKWRKVDDDDR